MSDAPAPEGPTSPIPSPIRRSTALKIVGTVVAIAAGVGAIVFMSLDSAAAQYMFADEAVANAATLQGKRIQVHGYVVKGSIAQKPGTLDYRFELETRSPRKPARVTVYYAGIVPDTFKSESEVVATGSLNANRDLQVVPDGIMAKCPSRYEAKDDITKVRQAAAAEAAPSQVP